MAYQVYISTPCVVVLQVELPFRGTHDTSCISDNNGRIYSVTNTEIAIVMDYVEGSNLDQLLFGKRK